MKGSASRSIETICALSSGALPSGVAIVRVSGPQAGAVAETLCGRIPKPRHAELMSIRTRNGALIDRGLVLFFPGPASFTGEDSVEFQLHGGRAVVQAILAAIITAPDVRLAEAGEFTLRAFLNGKIDLTQAEALADLIAAETESQRRAALRNADGAQRLLYDGWRARLLRCRALVEAELDFADEQETQTASTAMQAEVALLAAEIGAHLRLGRQAEIVRDGFRVTIIGAPNAGKSSLLNALARREVAIVTDEPGTTRDVIEVALDLGGHKVVLMDTAGIRDGAGRVEQIGIERAVAAAAAADLVLEAIDMSSRQRIHRGNLDEAVPRWCVGTKRDLAVGDPADFEIMLSASSGDGLDALLDRLSCEVGKAAGGDDPLPTRLRHRERLGACLERLQEVARFGPGELELAAESLRRAADALGAIIGATTTEDLLDVIFGEFCLGK